MPHCSYGMCNSDSRPRCPGYDAQVKFYRFPQPCLLLRNNVLTWSKQEENHHVKRCSKCSITKKWMLRCKRSDCKFQSVRQITNSLFVCSKHFENQEVDKIDYEKHVPSSLQPNQSCRRERLENRRTSVPVEGEDSFPVVAQIGEVSNIGTEDNDHIEPSNSTLISLDDPDRSHLHFSSAMEGTEDSVETKDATTQSTQILPYVLVLLEKLEMKDNEILRLRSEVKDLKKQVLTAETCARKVNQSDAITSFEKQLRKSDEMCKFYTGFTVIQMDAVKGLVKCDDICYWGSQTSNGDGKNEGVVPKRRAGDRKITYSQELILMLLRLRGGLLVEDISYRFSLSTSMISRVVTTWIQVLYQTFYSIRNYMFPSRHIIQETLPPRFKNFKNIRIIIDCAEISCECPTSFEQQGNCYSEYKSHTTSKLLIGCTPNGSVCFISDVFEGSISDREIVSQSGLIDRLEEGDLVLADRGFTIRDLTDQKGAVLKIPAFLKGRDCLTPQEEIDTREVAANRIFIEHVVGRLKQFRFFQRVVPLSMRPVLSQAVYICACFLNFQAPIVE